MYHVMYIRVFMLLCLAGTFSPSFLLLKTILAIPLHFLFLIKFRITLSSFIKHSREVVLNLQIRLEI